MGLFVVACGVEINEGHQMRMAKAIYSELAMARDVVAISCGRDSRAGRGVGSPCCGKGRVSGGLEAAGLEAVGKLSGRGPPCH